VPLKRRAHTTPVQLPRKERSLRTERHISGVSPRHRRRWKLVLVEGRRVVRGTGLLVVVVTEEVGRGRMLILRHHVVIWTANLGLLLLLAVIHEQRRVELRLAGRGWEDGEVSLAEVCSKQALLLLRKGARGQAAEGRGGVFGFERV